MASSRLRVRERCKDNAIEYLFGPCTCVGSLMREDARRGAGAKRGHSRGQDFLTNFDSLRVADRT